MTYNIFKEVLESEMNAIGIKKKKPKVVYGNRKQVGERESLKKDKNRIALPPGKRISKAGKVYYEYRKNRSDIPGLKI